MLTDTFTVKTFFDDFTSDPSRALRWGALRHDSGDPFEFIKMAKEAWTTVEAKAWIVRGEGKGRVGEGKMAVFSDSLDIDKALQIQAMCDEQGMNGKSTSTLFIFYFYHASYYMSHNSDTLGGYMADRTSLVWNRNLPNERFQKEIKSHRNVQTAKHRHQAKQDKRT